MEGGGRSKPSGNTPLVPVSSTFHVHADVSGRRHARRRQGTFCLSGEWCHYTIKGTKNKTKTGRGGGTRHAAHQGLEQQHHVLSTDPKLKRETKTDGYCTMRRRESSRERQDARRPGRRFRRFVAATARHRTLPSAFLAQICGTHSTDPHTCAETPETGALIATAVLF